MPSIPAKHSVTRDDVARACGVSGALVSYVFSSNARNKVKPDTREKILRTAEKMGYRPSLIGRSLKTRRSYNIALLLPESFARSVSLHQLRIFHGVCLAMQETDYRPMIFFGVNEKLFRTLEARRVDGIVGLDSRVDLKFLDALLPFHLPLVMANVEYHASAEFPVASVRSDHEGWVHDRLDELAAAGCRRILQIEANPDGCQPNGMMKRAFLAEMRARRHAGVRGEVYSPAPVPSERAVARLHEFFSGASPCDGVLIDGQEWLSPLLETAREHRVPLTPEVNCFTVESSVFTRPLWLHDSVAIGRRAWLKLADLLENRPTAPVDKVPYYFARTPQEIRTGTTAESEESISGQPERQPAL